MAANIGPPDHGQRMPPTPGDHITDECSVEDDPFARSTSLWHLSAKDMLEPLIPLIPEENAPFIRENALAILLGAVSIFVLILAGIVKLFLQSVKLKTIVLYGPMESGKTSLLHTLQGSELPNGTVSSMKPTEAVLTLPGSSKQVRVIDVPGHPRLRSVYETHASSASCIVFVLDSSAFVADKQTVAEQLYYVLQCQAQPANRRGRVVIACNKADLEERAFSQDFIVKQLEKEINSFRASKGAEVPGAAASQDGLGHQQVPFTFTTSKVPVSVCTISAAKSQLQGLLGAMEVL